MNINIFRVKFWTHETTTAKGVTLNGRSSRYSKSKICKSLVNLIPLRCLIDILFTFVIHLLNC
jgi:hypothetical protein